MYIDDQEYELDEDKPMPVETSPTNITKKSLSSAFFKETVDSHTNKTLVLRTAQSFTGAMEELKTNPNQQHMNFSYIPLKRSLRRSPSQVQSAPICPCGCLARQAVTGPFRTRELDTLTLLIVSPDVLSHHGYNYEPTQIAMFWKKDCRKFLWKGSSRNCVTCTSCPENIPCQSHQLCTIPSKLMDLDVEIQEENQIQM